MNKQYMRDVFIEELYNRMKTDKSIYFLTADLGSPALDSIRQDMPDRFLNVGIAEQNLINVATGLALEGFKVYAYAIAPFLTMRAYEQIRNNLSLLSQVRPMNVNLIGVGAGMSYVTSGPTHHSLEDLSIMRTLPNIDIISPSDCMVTRKFVDYSLENNRPKYIRLDGEPVADLEFKDFNIELGYRRLITGKRTCIVSTGYMTHTAVNVAFELALSNKEIGVIDVFSLRPIDIPALEIELLDYWRVITLEEAFLGKGGLDSLIMNIIGDRVESVGIRDSYSFEVGNREYLHKLNGIDIKGVLNQIFRKTIY